MFVVKPVDLPVIYEVPKEKRSLHELGIRDLTEVVIFDSEVEVANSNKSQLYHTVAQQFNIEKKDYEALLPKTTNNENGNTQDFFDSLPPPETSQFSTPKKPLISAQLEAPSSSAIPAEYANDPDLWHAIQASLGNESQALDNGANNTRAAIDDWMDIDERAFDANSPRAADDMVALNVSMDGGTPKKRQEVGPIFDESEFGPTGTAPRVQESALVNQIGIQKQQMTRAEHAKQLRERKLAQFNEKRDQARQKMMASRSSGFSTKESLRGQLGQQLRQFGEVSGHLVKLRTHIDQIMTGQMSMTEMYEQMPETEFCSSGALAMTPYKQKAASLTNMGHMSTENVVGAYEIDSECRTEDDDHCQENLSCEGGAAIDFDRESK